MNSPRAGLMSEPLIKFATVLHPLRLCIAACWAALIVFIVAPEPNMILEFPWLSGPAFVVIAAITAVFLPSPRGASEEGKKSGD